ncbi:MAG: SseB family protein [Lachnospiraceae bacterium]|nr:SseB family protein [Lachnospiraceae bacterium]
MTFKETGFRAVYHNFVVVKNNENVEKVIDDFPGAEDANAVLTYGYYDREAGLTLEILAAAIVSDNGYKYAKGRDDISMKLRIGAVEETEIFVCSDEDGKLSQTFADKLDMLKTYDASEDIEKTREMMFLDPCRHEWYIDDIMVRLMKDGLQAEGCWVRITGLAEHYFVGTLLNEPDQNFGWHEGETVAFFVHKTDDDKIICYTDMNPSAKVTEEDLADGSMLREAVKKFNEERNEPNFLDVLEILRDSYVWVPCNAILSDEDNARFQKMMEEKDNNGESIVGEEFSTRDQVRLVPDILQNGEDFFFPIFSSEEEMGEYGDRFSKIQKHILEVIPLARNNEKNVTGIVLDAFSNPFVLESKIFDIVEGMKSRIEVSKDTEE